MLQLVKNDAVCFFKITDYHKKLLLLSASFPLYIKHTWEVILWLFSGASENWWSLPPLRTAVTSVKFHQKKGSVIFVKSYSHLRRWIFAVDWSEFGSKSHT